MQDVDAVIQRTQRYWYEDGLVELAAGVLFLLIGALFAVEASAAEGTPLSSISAIGLPLIGIGGMWLGGRAVKWLKARLVYPRTGFVAYRRAPAEVRWVGAVAAVAIAAAAAYILAWASAPLDVIPLLDGAVVAAMLLLLARRFQLRHFAVLAVASVSIGALAAMADLGESLGSAAYFAGLGLALTVSGAVALRRYLRRTGPPAPLVPS